MFSQNLRNSLEEEKSILCKLVVQHSEVIR